MNNQILTNTLININSYEEIEINTEMLKSKPKLVSLMETIKKYKININDLTEFELNKLFECILIVSR